MVIGNPYEFAVIIEEIPAWNPGPCSFRNGILLYCFDGILFPSEVSTASLSHDVYDLLSRLKRIPTNQALFCADKDEVFKSLYHIRFPDDSDAEQDFRYDMTPDDFQDLDHFVFAVKGDEGVRILARHLPCTPEDPNRDLSSLHTLEAVIPHTEFDNLICTLEKWLYNK